MSNQDQPNQEKTVSFMRSTLDRSSSSVGFNLPNKSILKIRKINPSNLNITDEEKDRLFENHKNGEPIFIFKNRTNSIPSDNQIHSINDKNTSKIILRRIIAGDVDISNDRATSYYSQSNKVKRLVIGNCVHDYENPEQKQPSMKAFVLVPSQHQSNIQTRNIQINSLNSENSTEIENESDVTDIDLSGPEESENQQKLNQSDNGEKEISSPPSDFENVKTKTAVLDVENKNEANSHSSDIEEEESEKEDLSGSEEENEHESNSQSEEENEHESNSQSEEENEHESNSNEEENEHESNSQSEEENEHESNSQSEEENDEKEIESNSKEEKGNADNEIKAEESHSTELNAQAEIIEEEEEETDSLEFLDDKEEEDSGNVEGEINDLAEKEQPIIIVKEENITNNNITIINAANDAQNAYDQFEGENFQNFENINELIPTDGEASQNVENSNIFDVGDGDVEPFNNNEFQQFINNNFLGGEEDYYDQGL